MRVSVLPFLTTHCNLHQSTGTCMTMFGVYTSLKPHVFWMLLFGLPPVIFMMFLICCLPGLPITLKIPDITHILHRYLYIRSWVQRAFLFFSFFHVNCKVSAFVCFSIKIDLNSAMIIHPALVEMTVLYHDVFLHFYSAAIPERPPPLSSCNGPLKGLLRCGSDSAHHQGSH